MSIAAVTQLISVSSPREGQARFGQRCMTSPSGFTTSAPQRGQWLGIRNSFVPFAMRPGRPDDLRDHVPRALDDHEVALANLLAVDVLLVVERRARDGDAADLDRLEDPPRIESTGPADADRDLLSVVCAVIGAHLKARAQRGRSWSAPSRDCCSSESTLITIPSIS